eukprot:CAMPEP_0183487660 /NCGR_PEP_ID=MMETSP0370-20130417/180551_1 /TAXON_ID=268820 /ORGANISM="Peridinium aciculiferum, Strain PAER-2" /LENGTH=83 /DNA_ID=CAMNT_0025680987 /DNA_START=785 /DNA_END=1032 /DNA_ORIENTATION=+
MVCIDPHCARLQFAMTARHKRLDQRSASKEVGNIWSMRVGSQRRGGDDDDGGNVRMTMMIMMTITMTVRRVCATGAHAEHRTL